LTDSGQPWPGSFTHPLTLTLTSSNLGVTGEQVVRFDGPSALTTMPATLHPGSVVITLGNDPDIAVLNPASAPGRAALSAATQVHTGRPLAGETALSLGLVVLGAGLVLIGYRRRPTS
jgi:hypothetical protein